MARPADKITISLTRTEALALLKVAGTGLRVTEVLGLVQSTAATERAINALSAAVGHR